MSLLAKKIGSFALLFAVVILTAISFSSIVNAQALDDLTDEQRAKITSNCVVIKSSLEQLHASDALLRVNRGQVYESLATNLMEPFNTRLSNNRLDSSAMTTVTSQYRTALNQFRTDYIAYEQKLAEAIKIDCSSQPDKFHDAVLVARSLRSTVHDDIQKLHRSIDDYRLSVGDFLLNYERISR